MKATFIGIAVTLAAVSIAHASDKVVSPDSNAIGYLPVCDVYGAGFFYIPGTQTCMQLSGYAWFEIGATNDKNNGRFDPVTGRYAGDTGDYNFFPKGRTTFSSARVNLDVRSDTELGVLRSYARIQAESGSQYDGSVRLEQGYIELGGFRAGRVESAWAETTNGVSSMGSHSWNGMWRGYQFRQLMQYNYKNDGLFGTLSLEAPSQGGGGYMPDVVGLIGYEKDWGAVWMRSGYIAEYGDDLHGVGVSLGSQINVGSNGSSLRLIGFYADGDHLYGTGGPTWVAGGWGNAEWSLLGSYYQQITKTVGASVAVQYFEDFYQPNSTSKTNVDGWSAEVAAAWMPINNFEIRSEIQYDVVDGMDGVVSGYFRITRAF
ncbi:porin [Rhizobium sp. ZPR3]|uniref:Porin n=2 Tax=unclassified Rhizobium TaxID=2613769 RepID=A0AAU7SQV1_9HYPH